MKATRTEKFLSFKTLCCYRQNPREAIWKKATEQNFPVVSLLCCTRWFYKLLSLWMKSYGVTIQMKATEQYFPVVLFIMLYKVVLTFESVDEILWCDHSNESYIRSSFL